MSVLVVVDFPRPGSDEAYRAATAVVAMVAARMGSSVAEIDAASVAFDELLEAVRPAALASIRVEDGENGTDVVLGFAVPGQTGIDPGTSEPGLPRPSADAELVIDAGLDRWSIGATSVVIAIDARSRPDDP